MFSKQDIKTLVCSGGVGFGTYGLKADEMRDIIFEAIQSGYRLFDTAYDYGNEREFGCAIQECIEKGLVRREELFIQTKFYPETPYGYENVYEQFELSMKLLGLDYVDAYLFHKPIPWHSEQDYEERNIDAWRAFSELKTKGLAKHIGVSNFLERHIEFLNAEEQFFPEINQLEIHPLFQQMGLTKWCERKGILVEGWSPLGRGKVLNNDYIIKLSQKYNKTPAQICLRWQIQNGTVPITSANVAKWVRESFQSIYFEIDEEDMRAFSEINSHDQHQDLWMYKRAYMY